MRDDIRPRKKREEESDELDWFDQLFSDPTISDSILKEEFQLEAMPINNQIDSPFILPSEFELLEQEVVFEEPKVKLSKKILKKKKIIKWRHRSNKVFFYPVGIIIAVLLLAFIFTVYKTYSSLNSKKESLTISTDALQESISVREEADIVENVNKLAQQSNDLGLSLQRNQAQRKWIGPWENQKHLIHTVEITMYTFDLSQTHRQKIAKKQI